MIRLAILALSFLALGACDDSHAQAKAEEKLRKAISDVICNQKQEDLKFAMADLADAGEAISEDVREDTIWNLTAQVQKQGCGPASQTSP